ncbi:hypothetical protein EON63_05215 [archaeon]|nr:MAG: hypothetical protein EON63_05215 [archaeon]
MGDSIFGTMSYTALQNLTGLTDPIDYGSGVQWASGLMARYPQSAIQLGLWLVGKLSRHTPYPYPYHAQI